MKTLKVYDLNDFLLREDNLEAFHYKKVAIFEGRLGATLDPYLFRTMKPDISSALRLDALKPDNHAGSEDVCNAQRKPPKS